jgi:hypothetical protein
MPSPQLQSPCCRLILVGSAALRVGTSSETWKLDWNWSLVSLISHDDCDPRPWNSSGWDMMGHIERVIFSAPTRGRDSRQWCRCGLLHAAWWGKAGLGREATSFVSDRKQFIAAYGCLWLVVLPFNNFLFCSIIIMILRTKTCDNGSWSYRPWVFLSRCYVASGASTTSHVNVLASCCYLFEQFFFVGHFVICI